MSEFMHNGLRFRYEVSGEGKPLVFLHGLGGSMVQIKKIYEPISGVQLINMDQQGHGESDIDLETLSFDSMGDDVIALLDHLGLQQVYLAGISMGAAVSLNIATRYPQRVKKLLLIRNAWTNESQPAEVQQVFKDCALALKDNDIEKFYATDSYKKIFQLSAYTTNAFTSYFKDAVSVKNYKKYLILPNKVPIPSLAVLKNLIMPVMILANDNDLAHPITYSRYLHEHIPGAVYHEIVDKDKDAVGHREAVNFYLRKLLSE